MHSCTRDDAIPTVRSFVPHSHRKCLTPYPDLVLSLPACHNGILELDLQQVLGLQQRLLEAGHLRLQLAHTTTGLQRILRIIIITRHCQPGTH